MHDSSLMTWFPEDINAGVLSSVTLLQRRLKENPALFDDPTCFYDDKVKDWFLKTPATVAVEAIALAVCEVKDLETEARELYSQLKGLKPSGGFDADSKDGITYVKVAVQLLDKLLDCQERAAGIAEIERFKAIVMETMADLMTPEQRTQFMDRLKAADL